MSKKDKKVTDEPMSPMAKALGQSADEETATGYFDSLSAEQQLVNATAPALESFPRHLDDGSMHRHFQQYAPGSQAMVDAIAEAVAEKLEPIIENAINAAQQAQISIAQDNASIQSYVQEIQAMQAPLIAEQTAALENQLEVIAGYGVEQQAVALGWLDAASAAKAMEIQTLAASVAAGDLGTNGEAAFQSYINGITATDPVMTEMLQSMGLIEEKMNADGTYTVNLDGVEGAISDMDRLTASIVGLVDLMDNGVLDGSFSIDVEANTEDAMAGISEFDAYYRELDGTVVSTGVDADTGQATSSIMEIVNQIGGIDGQTSTVYVAGDGTGGSTAISTVASALGNLDGDVATTYANTVDSASGVLQGVRNLINALDGDTATTYIDTVYRSIGRSAARAYASDRHGGVAGYALGGVIAELAEAGPEILHFATGGSAMVYDRGLYEVPHATYVSPNNAVTNNSGGNTFVANFYGGGNRDEMNRWAQDEFIPLIIETTARHERGQGVRS